jgi:hypothetical protein
LEIELDAEIRKRQQDEQYNAEFEMKKKEL